MVVRKTVTWRGGVNPIIIRCKDVNSNTDNLSGSGKNPHFETIVFRSGEKIKAIKNCPLPLVGTPPATSRNGQNEDIKKTLEHGSQKGERRSSHHFYGATACVVRANCASYISVYVFLGGRGKVGSF